MITKQQQQVLNLYLEGKQAHEIQQLLGFKYIDSVYTRIRALKLKGIIKNEQPKQVSEGDN